MAKEKNFYINIPNSPAAELWVNSKKASKEILNIGDNEVILPIFDPDDENLKLAFHIELKESKVNKFRVELELLGADFSESSDQYLQKHPPKANAPTN